MADPITDFLNYLNANSGSLLFISNILLVIITGAYVILTKRILESTKRDLDLSYSPVIGIRINDMTIGPVYGPDRRNFGVGLTVVNVGNAPAIQVLVDSEIVLKYTEIEGEKVIPARFEPSHIPYIRQGEEITGMNVHQSFGNSCISQMIFDFLREDLLNRERIQNQTHEEAFYSSKLRIFVYYKNHLNQYFLSAYETTIHPWTVNGVPIPGFAPTQAPLETPPVLPNDQPIELIEIAIPRPTFIANPIDMEKMNKDIEERNRKRRLSGW